MQSLTTAQVARVLRIKERGYESVSSIDPLMWRKRKVLDALVVAGVLIKYTISPSYDGYRIAP